MDGGPCGLWVWGWAVSPQEQPKRHPTPPRSDVPPPAPTCCALPSSSHRSRMGSRASPSEGRASCRRGAALHRSEGVPARMERSHRSAPVVVAEGVEAVSIQTAPTPTTTNSGGDDALTHEWCCDWPLALCGKNLSADHICPDDGDGCSPCVVCVDLIDVPCRPGCPE